MAVTRNRASRLYPRGLLSLVVFGMNQNLVSHLRIGIDWFYIPTSVVIADNLSVTLQHQLGNLTAFNTESASHGVNLNPVMKDTVVDLQGTFFPHKHTSRFTGQYEMHILFTVVFQVIYQFIVSSFKCNTLNGVDVEHIGKSRVSNCEDLFTNLIRHFNHPPFYIHLRRRLHQGKNHNPTARGLCRYRQHP